MAQTKNKLSIRLTGINICRTKLDSLGKSLPQKIADKQYEITKWLALRSKFNAPILTGALRRSIEATKPTIKGGKVANQIKSDLPYALRLHEHPFRLGPISAQQPPTPEGGVGHKYISRVIDFYRGWVNYEWQKFVDNI